MTKIIYLFNAMTSCVVTQVNTVELFSLPKSY